MQEEEIESSLLALRFFFLEKEHSSIPFGNFGVREFNKGGICLIINLDDLTPGSPFNTPALITEEDPANL